ncbi:hypothetical protein GOP47_0023309 [Adiantum capillus-veneris]|uniref:Uncharacterized protein n=1 Tax=Adiantum capillus-veneris TaxID=13818 RepID=A0A9D4Z6E2_ADICA|nr:hypothetical protein GOP47_0023309 [Adiantum capillus-veneris]
MEQQKAESCKEDATMPQDIEKRFQHLVNEWFSFQKRAGFLGSSKEVLFSNLSQPSENSSKPHSDDNDLTVKPISSYSPTTPELLDRKKLVLDGCEQNTWNDLCNMLSNIDTSPKNQKQQENAIVCFLNKEEQLRLTERKLQEEQAKLSEAQSELLSKREKLLQQQQQEKAILDSKLKAMETGKAVLSKFYAALKDVLFQLEHRAKALQDSQLDGDQHNQIVAEGNEHFLSYELESFLVSDEATEFNNLSLLAAGFDAENWCVIVSAICQRFTTFLARETHLKEWASVLKKDAAKLLKLEKEMNEAKETSAVFMKNLEDEKRGVTKERDNLAIWERQLQDCKQAVAESERECAVSLAEVQKQAAELAVEESLIQEKKQQLDVLEKQLKKTLHDMQLETENLTKQKLLIEEKEKAVERQRVQVKEENDKLREEWEKLKGQKISDSKEREATKDLQGRLSVKEDMRKGIEKELEEKCLAVESLARKLNAREKLLKNIQKQSEEDRIQLNDLMKKLDGERRSLEEAKAELELSTGNVEAARESLSQDIKSADERMKERESRLKQQEEEAQQKQEFLEGLEAQVKNEQQRCHLLHTKVQKEQEKMAEELTEQESNLRKLESILERKEGEIRKNLQKLTDKRNLVDMKLKQLKEIETRTESLEEELHKQHQEHLLKVELHSKDYQNQVEHLETVQHDLQQKSADIDRRFQDVRALKKEVKLWQKETEKDLNNKVEELLKEKSNVELQRQNLKNLQYEVEKAGTKVIDHLVNLDQASKKLDKLREKLDTLQEKWQMIANHNAKQHKLLTERETNL